MSSGSAVYGFPVHEAFWVEGLLNDLFSLIVEIDLNITAESDLKKT